MKNFKKIVAFGVAMSMLFGIVSCDSLAKSKKSKESDDAEELVIDTAESFVKNLKKMDSSKLSKMSKKLDESFVDDYEFIDSEIRDVLLDSVDFEIDEDSLDVDDDEASIKVKYTYVDLSDINCSSMDEFIEEVSDCDDTNSGKFTIEFEIDDDECTVTNAKDIVNDFYSSVLNDELISSCYSSSPVVNYDFTYDYPFFVYPEYYSVTTTEDLVFIVSCNDYEDFDDETINVVVSDESGNHTYSFTCTFFAGTEYSFEISPEDLGLSEFEAYTYCMVEASFENYDYYDYDEVYIEEDSEPVVPSNPSGSLNTTDIPAEYKGYISGNSYYNDHFGFSIDLPAGAEEYDVSLFSFAAMPEGMIAYVLADSEAANYLSNGGYIDDNDLEGFVMVVVEAVDESGFGRTIDDTAEFFDMTIYDVDGVRYIRQDGDPVNQSGLIFIDEYCLLMLFVNGSDTDEFYAMEDSIKAI